MRAANTNNMEANTYYKYVANVWIAKCPEKHDRGEVIPVETKYGKENDSVVFNLIFEKEGFFFYSIIRADGMNAQEYARKRAERYGNAAGNAERKSDEHYSRSHAITDHIPMGQPILVGHHSERRHRRDLEKSWNHMDKSVEFGKKAAEYECRAEYWEKRTNVINLSMPESVEFYEYQVEKLKAQHEGLKNGTIPRSHSFSLTYAKKAVNDAENNLKIAKKLWL